MILNWRRRLSCVIGDCTFQTKLNGDDTHLPMDLCSVLQCGKGDGFDWRDEGYGAWHFTHCESCRTQFLKDEALVYFYERCSAFTCPSRECSGAATLDDTAMCTDCRTVDMGGIAELDEDEIVEWDVDVTAESDEYEIAQGAVSDYAGLVENDIADGVRVKVDGVELVEDERTLKIIEIVESDNYPIPFLGCVLATLQADYQHLIWRARREPNAVAAASVYGAAGTLSAMVIGMLKKMEVPEIRQKYLRKQEEGQVCEFCFTFTRALNSNVAMFYAKMCDRCYKMLQRELE